MRSKFFNVTPLFWRFLGEFGLFWGNFQGISILRVSYFPHLPLDEWNIIFYVQKLIAATLDRFVRHDGQSYRVMHSLMQ